MLSTKRRLAIGLAVALVYALAMLVMAHAAHAQPMPITCHEVARQAAAQQEFLAQLTCSLLTLIIWM